MKLYELAESYLNLQELLENPEVPQDLITSALEQVGEELEVALENAHEIIEEKERLEDVRRERHFSPSY